MRSSQKGGSDSFAKEEQQLYIACPDVLKEFHQAYRSSSVYESRIPEASRSLPPLPRPPAVLFQFPRTEPLRRYHAQV